MHNPSDKAQRVVDRLGDMRRNRGNFDSHWDEVAERFLPAHAGTFTSNAASRTQGEKRSSEIYNSAPAIALTRFAAIIDSLLTPRDRFWHKLRPSDPGLMQDHEVASWFEQVTRILFSYRYTPAAGFAANNQLNYVSLGAYGTTCMLVEKGPPSAPGLRYRHVHIADVYLAENAHGRVDTVFRCTAMTVRQVMQEWGEKGQWTDHLRRTFATWMREDPDKLLEIVHVVRPRSERKHPHIVGGRNKPWESLYVLKDEGPHILHEGGYDTFPYVVSRWRQAPGEVYGRGPAMDVLPAVKTLMEQAKTALKVGQRAVDPVLFTHDDGVLGQVSMIPGTVHNGGVSADGKPLVHALPSGRFDVSFEMMQDSKAEISAAFLNDLFQILVETSTMSATEALHRAREKVMLLAPIVGRQADEYLGPLIEREVDLLVAQRLLPRMPEALAAADGDYKIELDSPLSRAQRAEEASGFLMTIREAMEFAGATGDPTPMFVFNLSKAIRETAVIQGTPVDWLNPPEVEEQMKQAHQQQQQLAQASQAAPGAAQMIKALDGVTKQEGKQSAG